MIMCFGPNRNVISMNSDKDYTLDDMMQSCSTKIKSGNTVCLEYQPNLYIPIRNQKEMIFACTMVCEYHNHIRSSVYGQTWKVLNTPFPSSTIPR